MARTRSAKFADAADRYTARKHFVVRFVTGSLSKAYSDVPIEIADALTAARIEPRLIGGISFGESVNPWNCTFPISTVNILLDNRPSGKTRTRPSDSWSSFWGLMGAGTVEIYALAGNNVTSYADMFLVFKGIVDDLPLIDGENMKVTAMSYGSFQHQPLPTREVSSYSPTIEVDKEKKVPFAYGVFGSTNGTRNITDGGADPLWEYPEERYRAVRISTYRWILSRGQISTDSRMTFKKKDGLLIEEVSTAVGYSFTGGNTEYIRAAPEPAYLNGQIFRSPKKVGTVVELNASILHRDRELTIPQDIIANPINIALSFKDGALLMLDSQAMMDGSNSTYAFLGNGDHLFLASGSGDDAGDKAAVVIKFDKITGNDTLQISLTESEVLAWRAELHTQPAGYSYKYGISYVDENTRYTGTEVRFNYVDTLGFSNGNDNRRYSSDIFDGTVRVKTATLSPVGLATDAYAAFLVFASKEAVSDPGSLADMMKIFGVTFYSTVRFTPEVTDEVWVSGSGILISSVIGARAGNPLGTADVNKFPCFVIEDILREELGVQTAEINEAEFDAAYDATQTCQVAIDNSNVQHSLQLFQELSENSAHAYFCDCVSKHRLVSRAPSPPGSATAIFGRADIFGLPTISDTPRDNVLNQFKVKYDHARQSGEFRNSLTINDSTSQSIFGIRSGNDMSLRYCTRATAENASSPFRLALAKLRLATYPVCKVQVKNWKALHLEIGDWFEIDTSMDAVFPFRDGATWAGKKFYILSRNVNDKNNVTLEGVQF